MSVINQMLRDLARRSKPLAGPEVILSGLTATDYVKPEKNKFKYAGLLSGIALMSMLIFLNNKASAPQTAAKKEIPEIMTVKPTASASIQSYSKPDFSLEPTHLTGITFQVEKDRTLFRFLLNQNTLYRVNSCSQNELSIILENTKLMSSVPQIDTMVSAVKMMRVMELPDGSLKIILKFNQNTELKQLALNDSGKFSELQMDVAEDNSSQLGGMVKKLSYDTTVYDDYIQMNKSVNLLVPFVEQHPDFVPARKTLMLLLLKENKLNQALHIVDTGLTLRPGYLPFVQLKAKTLVQLGKADQALMLLQTSAPAMEENPDYYSFIAALAQREHHFLLAQTIYERLLSLQPDNSIWWMGLGISLESLRKNAAALEAYQKSNTSRLSPELKVYVENRMHALTADEVK